MVRRVLYINNVEIPLSQEISMPVTYQIADISNPETRQGNYSKTIDIPSSKITDALFGYCFDVSMNVDTSGSTNFSPDFNPNLKASAKILGDSIEEFNGFAQLLDVTVTDNLDIIYHVALLGKLTNLFDEIGDKELTDLDFSEYNHTYNLTNIQNSWSSVPGSGYLYELINRGFSTDLVNFPLTSFYPSFYEREYLLKIFRDAGYVWDSNFLDSLYVKKQTIPYSSPYMRLGETAILNRKFRASKTGTTSFSVTSTANNTIVFDDETTPPNFDTSAQYNNANGSFTVGTGLNGVFTFNATVIMGYTLTPTTPGVSVTQERTLQASYQLIKVDAATGTTTVLASVTQFMKHIGAFTTTYTTANPASSTDDDFSIPSTNRNYVYLSAPNVSLNVGDIVRVRITSLTTATGVSVPYFKEVVSGADMGGTYTLHTYANSVFFNTVDNPNLVEGMPVLANDCLPPKIKQRDFVSNIIKKYNLYFEQDPDQTNKFKIEPRDDYYTTTVKDWTQKLAQDRELKIIPMGALDFKHLTLKYKDDSDYFNNDYQNEHKESYGQRDIDINNDFVQKTKTIELLYSPTPSVGNGASNRIIPTIVKIDDTGVTSPHTGNLRSLYYGGLKTSNTTWNIIDSTGAHPFTTYPFSGMVDDPYNPTIDIGFGVPWEIYWQPIFDDITYTNNNHFNRFYRGYLLDVANPNSKIVEGWFNLTVVDIATLDFKALYYFEKEYFRLIKVSDYDPISSELTKCTFLKVAKVKTFTAEELETIGNYDDYAELMDGVLVDNAVESTPAYATPRMPNNNTGNTRSGTGDVYGFNNRIGNEVQSYFIKGNNNSIGDYCNNVTILDSSGVSILGNISNVTVIRSNGVTINEGDILVINGQYYGKGSSVEFVNSSRSYSGKSRFVEIDATSGNISLALGDVANYTEPITIIRIDNQPSYFVAISGLGSQTINKQLNLFLRNQYDSVTIFPDGDEWYATGKTTPGFSLVANAPTLNPADSTTYYFGAPYTATVTTTGGRRRVYVPKGGDLKSIYLFGTCTAGSSESVSFYLRVNDTSDVLISSSVNMSTSPFTASLSGEILYTFVKGDYFEIKEVTPAWATNPTAQFVNVIAYIE